MQDSSFLRRFGNLLLSTAVLTLVLVFVGVIVRATGSGLGCGTAGGWHDWPLCHGQLIPPGTVDALIEFSHRACAAVVSVCLVSAAVWTWADSRLRQAFGWGMVLALGLLVLQITLGALTVRVLHGGEINPAFVVAHLATAFAFFGTVLTLGLHARCLAGGHLPLSEFPPGIRLYALITTAFVLFQAIVGGLVANLGASMACPEFPACAGGVWIPSWTGPVGLQVLHRLGAVVVTGLLFGLAFGVRRQPTRLKILAHTALGLVLVQFALGVVTVLLGLPLMARAAHHVTAYALFGTAVALCHVVFAGRARSAAAPSPAVAAVG